MSHFFFFLHWFLLCVASFQFSWVQCSLFILVVSYFLLSLLFLAIKVFFSSSFLSFLSPCCKGPTSLCFMFRHFNLLLLVFSLSLHLVIVCSVSSVLAYYCLLPPLCFTLLLFVTSFMIGPIYCCLLLCLLPLSHLALLLPIPSFIFSPIVAYSTLFHTWPYCCMFPPLCFALLLHVPSLMFEPNVTCSLFHVSPYYCMLLPSCFVLLVPTPSLMFGPIVASSFLCASPCYYMFPPLSFALLLAYSFMPHPIVST